jgi:hypothetical protein
MSRWLAWSVPALLAMACPVQAAGPSVDDPVSALAKKIDRHISAGLSAKKAVAAPLAGDHEFVRRVYLDIAGRIPKVAEVRAFVEDKSADKRRKLVDKLLAGTNYTNHFSNVWRNLLLPNGSNQQAQFFAGQITNWIRPRLRANKKYDEIVRELVAARLPEGGGGRPGFPGMGAPDQGAVAFFQANEMKPDTMAAATSRLFLGVKIECAQCHDHPFAKWSRKQFWEYAAFFGGINPGTDNPKVREVKIGGGEKKAKAKFLDGSDPVWGDNSRARSVLAEWLTKPTNPYLSKAFANRMWEHFFGVGIVDPVDDARDENPPSHPALLSDLARAFVDSGFDMKFMIRAITASETYQRSSLQTHASQEDLRLFARMPLKGLTPEQVFDSLATAVGYRGDSRNVDRNNFIFGNMGARQEILARFNNPVDKRTEYQTSILQALALMNGRFVADATHLQKSETLAAIIDLPTMTTRQKLDTLYLAAVARPMRGSEVARLVPYVEKGGPSKDSKKALADVFWVLLNSSEFILNH